MRTRKKLVSFALCALGIGLLLFAGCRKEEDPVVPPSAPDAYMKDPAFRSALTEKRKEREDYFVTRTKIVRELEKMVAAKKAAMPGADDAAVKAALEKDPEWNDLSKRVEDLTVAIRENQREAQGLVRERLAPKKEISK